jgi:hypothetical protein
VEGCVTNEVERIVSASIKDALDRGLATLATEFHRLREENKQLRLKVRALETECLELTGTIEIAHDGGTSEPSD